MDIFSKRERKWAKNHAKFKAKISLPKFLTRDFKILLMYLSFQIHLWTLGLRLWTDVLEFLITLMEQLTFDN